MRQKALVKFIEQANTPLFSNSIFTEDATKLVRASNAEIEANHYSEKLANQLYYSVKSQEGKFYGYSGLGYGGSSEGNQMGFNWKTFTQPLYIVPPSQSTVKCWFVKSNTGAGSEEIRTKGEEEGHANLGTFFTEVPMPTPSLTVAGSPNANQIWAEGTDAELCIWRPSTDEYWEMWGAGKFAAGEHKGEYRFANGAYLSEVSKSNGVLPHNWGARACGLAATGGDLSIGDIIRVLEGGKIGHALGIEIEVTKNEHLAPATRNDSKENTHEFQENGETPNPAHGTVDAVPEGAWFAFPSSSKASEFVNTSTEPLATAVYEAIREHGLFVNDSAGGGCNICINDPRVLGSPYAEQEINPFANWEGAEPTLAKVNEYIHSVPEKWIKTELPHIKENFTGKSSVFVKMPWRKLEQLAPRSS